MSILSKLKRKKSRLLLSFLVTTGGILTPQNTFAEEEVYVKMPYELSSNEEFDSSESSEIEKITNNKTPSEETSESQTEDLSTKESADSSSENKSDADIEYKGESPNTTDNTNNENTLDAEDVPGSVALMRYLNQFQGKTIVDIEFEGASYLTLPTIQIVTTQHVGDEFDSSLAMRDMDLFVNTGYFYDVYPKIEEVPEGVVVTYHLLEHPIVNDIKLTGNTVEKTEVLESLITLRRG